jgi:hypothetical protein
MKRQSAIINILTMLALAGCTVLSPTAAPISHVYAFGDSYSDNGNLARLWGGRMILSCGKAALQMARPPLRCSPLA